MKRITEIGSLLSSPLVDLRTRGAKELREAIQKMGTLTATATHLGVSLRSVQRWAHGIGIEMNWVEDGWKASESKPIVRRKNRKSTGVKKGSRH